MPAWLSYGRRRQHRRLPARQARLPSSEHLFAWAECSALLGCIGRYREGVYGDACRKPRAVPELSPACNFGKGRRAALPYFPTLGNLAVPLCSEGILDACGIRLPSGPQQQQTKPGGLPVLEQQRANLTACQGLCAVCWPSLTARVLSCSVLHTGAGCSQSDVEDCYTLYGSQNASGCYLDTSACAELRRSLSRDFDACTARNNKRINCCKSPSTTAC